MHRFRNTNRFKTDNRDSFDSRPTCRYGASCYQKNPHHMQRFKHPEVPVAKNNTWTNTSNKRKINNDKQNTSQAAKKPNTGSGGSGKSTKKSEKEDQPTAAAASDSKNEEMGAESNDQTMDEAPEITNNGAGEKNGDVTNDKESTQGDGESTETDAPKEITVVDLEDENEAGSGETKTEGMVVETVQETASKKDEPVGVNETVQEETVSGKGEPVATEETVQDEPKPKEESEEGSAESKANDETKNEKMDCENSTVEKQHVETTIAKPIKTGPKDQAFYDEAQKLIVKFFLMPMPKDFFKFYDLCQELKPSDPSSALSILNIKLVGPYDVLNGLITNETPDTKSFLLHWRYFYDPPEFQTVLKGNDKEGLHFGYWRDRPSSDPIFVASNSSTVSHKIKPVAENVFGAVAGYLEDRLKRANPFEKAGFNNLLAKIKSFANKHEIILDAQTPKMKSREKNVVARTIHGAGIVCPFNKKTQLGYRELSVTDNQLLKIVKKIDDAANDEARAAPHSELSEVVRLATIAGDECDFGTCLELGHDLLSTGCTYVQNAALAMLTIAYEQLERRAFLKIAEAHLTNRKKGPNLSELSDTSSVRVGLF